MVAVAGVAGLAMGLVMKVVVSVAGLVGKVRWTSGRLCPFPLISFILLVVRTDM